MNYTQYPVVLKILLPLVSGILLSRYCAVDVNFSAILIALTLLGAAFGLRGKNKVLSDVSFSLVLFVFFSMTGMFLENNSDNSKDQNYFSNYTNPDSLSYFHLELKDDPAITEKWTKCEASVIALNDSLTTGTIQLFIERDSLSEKLNYGDQIYASGFISAINPPMNPNEFDYRTYLKLHDIHHQLFIRKDHWLLAGNNANPVLEKIYVLRNYCSEVFDASGMQKENIAVAKALILGDKTLINDELMLSFASAGALHVLAVSGLHVGIVMLILGFVLKPLKRLKNGKYLFLFFTLAGIWFYAILTGLSPSVLRAAVMFSFVMIGLEMQRDTSIYQSLMVSAIILILSDPNIIFQLGFLLSYFAVAGIVFFHPKIYRLLFFKNKIADKIWQISCVSIAAQIATFPLGIYCFQQFPNYFLLANLVVIPLAFLILITGIIALLVNTIPMINLAVFILLDWLIYFLNEGVRFVETLPYSVFESIVINWYDTILLYLFIILLSYALIKKSKISLQLSFAFLATFFVSGLFDSLEKSATKQVVFYTTRDQVVTDIFTGKKFRTISTLSAEAENSDIKFHVQPNRIFQSGKKWPEEYYLINDSLHIFSFENRSVLFADQNRLDSIYSKLLPKTDAIYLYDCKFISDELIKTLAEQETFVIMGQGCSYNLKKYLSKSLSNFYLYDIANSGALVFQF